MHIITSIITPTITRITITRSNQGKIRNDQKQQRRQASPKSRSAPPHLTQNLCHINAGQEPDAHAPQKQLQHAAPG